MRFRSSDVIRGLVSLWVSRSKTTNFTLSSVKTTLATKSQLPYLRRTVNYPTRYENSNQDCPKALLCPLSQVGPGVAVRIKQISHSPEVSVRLRELGFCEEQCIRLISRQNTLLCQVCQARVGISSQLADKIWVEPIQKVA